MGILVASGFASLGAIGIILLADPFVELFFPAEWGRVSEIMLVLFPTFVVRFVMGCVGGTPLALKKPSFSVAWNVVQLIVIALAWVYAIDRDLDLFLMISGSGLMVAGVIYLLSLWILIREHAGWEK
jgi:O-antigen/teichoic acid export membrane protein